MSSLRNSVQRRNHKERAQPLERSKWGLLEKHKDYSLRAKDHNAKKKQIKALQQKASERNEDEFYFGMMSSKTIDGVKVAKRGEANSGGGGQILSPDVVKLMKTQDVTYFRTVLQATQSQLKKVDQLVAVAEQGVPLSSSGKGRTLFDEDGKALPRTDLDEDDLDLDGLDSSEDERPQKARFEIKDKSVDTATPLERLKRKQAALRKRKEELTAAMLEVEDQKIRMGSKAGGVTKKGVKYKNRERRR